MFDPDSDSILAFGGDHRQLKSAQEVLNYGSVWISKDHGERWSLESQIAEDGNIMAASYAGGSDCEIYAVVWEHGFFYSVDDGATWAKLNRGLPEDENGNILVSSLAVHPDDSQVAWITVENFGIYKTTDGGNHWHLLDQGIPTVESEFWSVVVAQSGETLYAGNRNFRHQPGVYKSTDGGKTWEHKFYSIHQIDIRDKPYPGGINPWCLEISPTSPDTVYAGTDNALYRSVDGGEEWSVLTAKRTAQGWQGNGFSGLVATNIEWNPDDSSHVILQGMDGAKMIQSWDDGSNWRVNNPGLSPYSGGRDVAFSQGWMFGVFGQTADTTDLIARSQDSGHSWTSLESPISPSEATHVYADRNNPDLLWVVIGQQLWHSDNATQTESPNWTQLQVGFYGNAVGDIEPVPGSESSFYIATDNGIYYTQNGIDFRPIGGLKNAVMVELEISTADPNILYAAQDQSYWDDYGLWRYNRLKNGWSLVWDDRMVASRIGDLAIHPQNPNFLAIITNDFPYHDESWATGVWFSQDAGETWYQQNNGLPMLRGSTITFRPNGRSIVVGLGGSGFYTASLESFSQDKFGSIAGGIDNVMNFVCRRHTIPLSIKHTKPHKEIYISKL
ncbi:hypothetical protein C7271_00640 [filamentous cyanobacterium CCP5]|nr:hypothetical protein C7271_00640 [filamentous cyanobacterium CCP5]